MFISYLFSHTPLSLHRKMSKKEGNIHKASGTPREKNYAQGLSEDVVIEKNLQTPVLSNAETPTDRDNRHKPLIEFGP